MPTRQRILDTALVLMSDHGVAGTSMRMLAGACDLNVATLYHHFPSKADLLRAVLADRAYGELLRTEGPPPEVTRRAPAPLRLTRLLRWLWWASEQEEAVWRLLVGESLRGDPTARTEALALVDGIDAALEGWIRAVVPELAGDAARAARVTRATLFSMIVEQLALGPDAARVRARIADLVGVLLPDGK